MSLFFSFARKEFRHILRDRWTTVILLLLPIIMLTLFGYAISTEVRETSFAVCDPSRDAVTERIVELLDRSEYFRFIRMIDSPDEADELFRSGKIGFAVVFPPGFADAIGTGTAAGTSGSGGAGIEFIADGTDPNTAITLVSYATAIVNSYRASLSVGTSFPGVSASGVPVISTNTRLLYNPEMKSSYNFVPGVMGMVLMLVCAMMTSVSIAREKETGSMELLLVSPMRPILIIVAKAIPYLALSCVNLATILILAVFVFKVPIAGNLAALLVISIVFIFVALSLGLLISSVAQTQLVALLVSGMGLMMPTMLLSGMIFPVENMPVFLRVISDLLPARWYIMAVRKVMVKGLGFGGIATEIGVLSAMAAVLVSLSLRAFKVRLE